VFPFLCYDALGLAGNKSIRNVSALTSELQSRRIGRTWTDDLSHRKRSNRIFRHCQLQRALRRHPLL